MKRKLRIQRTITRLVILGILAPLIWLFLPSPTVTLTIDIGNRPPLLIKMSTKEKESLDYFFREALFADDMSFTLLGPKPISISGYLIPFRSWSWRILLSSIVPPNLKIKHGWETWQKYQHLFNQNRFILWAEPSIYGNGIITILIADRKKMNDIVQQHRDDFAREVENPNITAEYLLSMARKGSLFGDALHKNELLIGILLGYTKSNAELACKGIEFPSGEPAPTFWEHEDYVEHVYSLIRLHDKTQPISKIITYPMFAGDSTTEEGKKLKQEFLDAQGRISTYYEGKDFLEATLSLLATPDDS